MSLLKVTSHTSILQDLLRAQEVDEALIVFVQAVAASIFCLETLKDITEDIILSISSAEARIRDFGDVPLL